MLKIRSLCFEKQNRFPNAKEILSIGSLFLSQWGSLSKVDKYVWIVSCFDNLYYKTKEPLYFILSLWREFRMNMSNDWKYQVGKALCTDSGPILLKFGREVEYHKINHHIKFQLLDLKLKIFLGHFFESCAEYLQLPVSLIVLIIRVISGKM